jgi:hypothetical protein
VGTCDVSLRGKCVWHGSCDGPLLADASDLGNCAVATDLSQRVLGRRAGPRHKAPAVDFGLLHRSCRLASRSPSLDRLFDSPSSSSLVDHHSRFTAHSSAHLLFHPSEDENLHQKAPKSSDQSRFCCRASSIISHPPTLHQCYRYQHLFVEPFVSHR